MKNNFEPNEKKVAIIGAGTMGSGIAQKYASAGFMVTLVDQFEESLAKGRASIETILAQGVKRSVFSEDVAKEILGRISFTTDLTDVASSSLVVEAIFEDLSAKIKLFTTLEDICSTKTIFATNTSSFMVKDIQNHLETKERMIGLHYFFHPAKNRLVELIGTEKTSPEYLAKAKTIQELIKKTVITSKDSPGFIVNRFFVPWLNEACRMLDDNTANIATIEDAAKSAFGIKMGPFELMNVTGLPITYHACMALSETLGDFYAPSPVILNQLSKQTNWDLSGTVDKNQDAIKHRLLAVVILVAQQMVEDEKVCTTDAADLGAKTGLLWTEGPFALAEKYASPQLTEELGRIRGLYPSLADKDSLSSIPSSTIAEALSATS